MAIDSRRVSVLAPGRPTNGRYILYWMQQSQRADGNHALEYAIAQANQLELPLLVGFGLTPAYPEANLRHYRFMLEGLVEVRDALAARGIQLAVVAGDPPEVAIRLSEQAAMTVCDRGYTVHQRQWRDRLADHAACRVVQVESDVVVPVEAASDHAEFAARTIRPKIMRLIDEMLAVPRPGRLQRDSLSLRIPGRLKIDSIDAVLERLGVDLAAGPSARFTGGTSKARQLLAGFIAGPLARYHDDRNEPSAGIVSSMSPYLQFGQISPIEIALQVRRSSAGADAIAAYLEELVVRRELACNYCQFTPQYWTYDALPQWARRTLERHASDPRQVIYSRRQLEAAQTHDPYWNAAMREMTQTGYMHNYMRMYWGKCVLGWKSHPREAFEDLLYLNNKYFIDGRGPNGFAGVAWCFGLHDRPWGERPIYGQVRYMNAAGLERKFDMQAYIRAVDAMAE